MPDALRQLRTLHDLPDPAVGYLGPERHGTGDLLSIRTDTREAEVLDHRTGTRLHLSLETVYVSPLRARRSRIGEQGTRPCPPHPGV